MLSFEVFASDFKECGLEGSLEERLSDCSKQTRNMSLFFVEGVSQAWINNVDGHAYFSNDYNVTIPEMHWNDAKGLCDSLNNSLNLGDTYSNNWKLPSAREFPYSILREAFKDMRDNNFELHFWMLERGSHPAGSDMAILFSNEGYFFKWFVDTGAQPVCVNKLKI